MAFLRPRLTDYHQISLPQARADFAIPFLDEDIPLYLDPLLLWRSPSLQDQAKHEPAAAYLQPLDEATVPQNADALLVLGQFKAALEQFRERYMYYDEDEAENVWRVK